MNPTTKSSALLAVIAFSLAAEQAWAAYLGPDNNLYQYKVINWFHKDVENYTSLHVAGGQLIMSSDSANRTSITGVVVLGPTGIADFSASKFFFSSDQWNWADMDWGSDITRHFESYSPGGNMTWDYHYYRWCDTLPEITSPPAAPSAGSLGVSYPTSVDAGTTIVGSDYITVVGDAPDDIVGVSGYFYNDDEANFYHYSETVGEQVWAMITWTNTQPGLFAPPEAPDFADPEYQEELED